MVRILLINLFPIVTVTIKARRVTVKGPRGQITKNLSHVAIEMKIKKQNIRKRVGKFLHLKMYFGAAKQKCSVFTITSIIRNMIAGVTKVSKDSVNFLSLPIK